MLTASSSRVREGRLLITFSVIRLLCDKNTSNAYYPARRPQSLEPDHPESLSLLGHGHLQLGQPSLRRGGLRVERWGETMCQRMERENSFESDRCVRVIVHRGVVQLLDVGVMGLGFEGAPDRRGSCGCSRSPP
jgi:hypothetical protein